MNAVFRICCLVCFAILTATLSAQDPLFVDASETRLRGVKNVPVSQLFKTFEIEVYTGSGQPQRRRLEATGKQQFPVTADSVVRINSSDLQKGDEYVLWPVEEERVAQSPISNPFTKFELMTLENVREVVKRHVRTEVMRGAFESVNRVLHNVHNLYEDADTSPAMRPKLREWFHQLYQTTSTATEQYREQVGFHQLVKEQRVEHERSWHMWMIKFNKRLVEHSEEETTKVRLAYALREWANFAANVYCSDGKWRDESFAQAKAKGRVRAEYANMFLEDLTLIRDVLLSEALEPLLAPKIAKNLSPNLIKKPNKSETTQLQCYQALIEAAGKERFAIENFSLDKLDKAVSAFGYFFHTET